MIGRTSAIPGAALCGGVVHAGSGGVDERGTRDLLGLGGADVGLDPSGHRESVISPTDRRIQEATVTRNLDVDTDERIVVDRPGGRDENEYIADHDQ